MMHSTVKANAYLIRDILMSKLNACKQCPIMITEKCYAGRKTRIKAIEFMFDAKQWAIVLAILRYEKLWELSSSS